MTMAINLQQRSLVWVSRFCCLALIAALAGCGASTSEVSGKVTYKGQTVSNGTVALISAQNQMVAGMIGPDGAYRIPNVVQGTVQVTVRTHRRTPPGFQLKQNVPFAPDAPVPHKSKMGSESNQAPIPEKYGMPDQSGLVLNVTEPTQVFDINLK